MASKCTFTIPIPPLMIPFPPLPLIPIPDFLISFDIPDFSCPLD